MRSGIPWDTFGYTLVQKESYLKRDFLSLILPTLQGAIALSSPLLAANNASSSESILIESVGENFSIRSSNSQAITITSGSHPSTIDSISEIDINHADFITTGTISPITSSETTFVESRQTQLGEDERSIVQVAPRKISSDQNTFVKDSSTDVGILKVSPIQISTFETSPFEVGIVEHGFDHFTSAQVSPNEVTSSQVQGRQSNAFKVNPREVSLSTFDSSPEFFSIHKSTPQIINNLNNTATNIWSNLLQTPTQLDIDFQITDLPTGQLAEVTITGFDENGTPTEHNVCGA